MKTLPLAAVLLLGSLGSAQEPMPPMPKSFFKERRAALMKEIKSRAEEEGEAPGIILLRGGAKQGSMGRFYQDHDFYYLAGVNEPDVAVLMFPATGKDMLLVPPFNRFTASWEGKRLAPGERAAKITGFDEVSNSRALRRKLKEVIEKAKQGEKGEVTIWTILTPQPNATGTPSSARGAASARRRDAFDGRKSREQTLKVKLEGMYENVKVRDVTRLIHHMRGLKRPEEIARIKAATELACHGIAEAIKSTEPGVYEFQIEAAARYVFDRHGAGPDAYAAIVGAGANGCILHYSANTKKAESGELVVMDYAPTVQGYCSDVTRTFPVNGKFTKEQRKLVQDVYDVQQILIKMVKPGASLRQLSATCSRELVKRGYRSRHGPCHHVGLAVHDPGPSRLEPGMLITVEPGAYLDRKGMGCRIEDVILVTKDGCKSLSGHLPASPDAIEALMKQPGVHQHRVGFKK